MDQFFTPAISTIEQFDISSYLHNYLLGLGINSNLLRRGSSEIFATLPLPRSNCCTYSTIVLQNLVGWWHLTDTQQIRRLTNVQETGP